MRECRYLTSGTSGKRVLHVGLDVQGADMHFEPGDSVSLPPVNSPALVDTLIALLDAHPDTCVAPLFLPVDLPLLELETVCFDW